jgi:hypothetical protein
MPPRKMTIKVEFVVGVDWGCYPTSEKGEKAQRIGCTCMATTEAIHPSLQEELLKVGSEMRRISLELQRACEILLGGQAGLLTDRQRSLVELISKNSLILEVLRTELLNQIKEDGR